MFNLLKQKMKSSLEKGFEQATFWFVVFHVLETTKSNTRKLIFYFSCMKNSLCYSYSYHLQKCQDIIIMVKFRGTITSLRLTLV